MKSIAPNKQTSTTEMLFPEFFTGSNYAVMEQIVKYKQIVDIYERTQIALGRKVSFKSANCSTDKVKINLNVIGATNQI
jgi:hypothetical protein